MPSKSPKQAKTMAAIAHGWKPPASSDINIPVAVAQDFNQADKQSRMINARATSSALRRGKSHAFGRT